MTITLNNTDYTVTLEDGGGCQFIVTSCDGYLGRRAIALDYAANYTGGVDKLMRDEAQDVDNFRNFVPEQE